MQTKDFPSGPWTGFYQYRNGERGQQDLRLQFKNGRMTGTGTDELGHFTIEGSYDPVSKEAQWLKSYSSGHSIDYRGFREGPSPGIWGTWAISADWTGGFHIWPVGNTTDDETAKLEVQQPLRIGVKEKSYDFITSESALPMRLRVRDCPMR